MSGDSRTPEQESSYRTRRAFLAAGVAAAAGYGGWRWLQTRPDAGGLIRPFRKMLGFNESVAEVYYNPRHLSPSFPASRIQNMRLNGDIGLGSDFEPGAWRLKLTSLNGRSPSLSLTLSDIQALPRVEYITPLYCIEGWDVIQHWAGARFSDFTRQFAPESIQAPYVSLQTPKSEYYVGLHMASALHPQTLLCYEMNGAPLTMEHGAPLRLAIPIKYGIKNLKRIGSIAYTAERPRDYWAEQGYDWYAGL